MRGTPGWWCRRDGWRRCLVTDRARAVAHDEEDRVRETYGAALTRVQAVNASTTLNAFAVNPNIRPLA